MSAKSGTEDTMFITRPVCRGAQRLMIKKCMSKLYSGAPSSAIRGRRERLIGDTSDIVLNALLDVQLWNLTQTALEVAANFTRSRWWIWYSPHT